MDIYATNWTEADASNSTAAPDGWPEGMMPSGVDDAGRAMMGATKRYVDQQIPLVTGGTSTAYTLAYAVAPAQLYDGMTHLVQFNAVNGAAPTLNVNALGAKPLHFYAGAAWGACPANMFAVDQVVRVTYNAAAGTYRCIDTPMILNQSVSGAASVTFQGIPTNVTNLEIVFDLTFATNNVNLGLQFYNSAGTLDSSSIYQTLLNSINSSGPNIVGSWTPLATGILISTGVSNSTGYGCNGGADDPEHSGSQIHPMQFPNELPLSGWSECYFNHRRRYSRGQRQHHWDQAVRQFRQHQRHRHSTR